MIHRHRHLKGAALAAAVALLFVVATPAHAGICFTSGRVYIQQKVFEKACWYLECAREEEPTTIPIYNLLAFARAQQQEYISAGGALALGLQLADKDADKNKKEIEKLVQTRKALNVDLYNKGIAAFGKAGQPSFMDGRTQGQAGTPQDAVEKEYGAPPYYGIVNENGRTQEFWFYPDKGKSFHFGPDEVDSSDYHPYEGLPKPEVAVVDTVQFGPYTGGSYFAEAAYWFRLASYVDPTSIDTYSNLSFAYGVLGRAPDAMRAAKLGLALDPKNASLQKNLRAAAMSTGQRFFASGEYPSAIKAFYSAMEVDTASTLVYMDRIASSWYAQAQKLEKGPERSAAYDSASAAFQRLLQVVPADADSAHQAIRENALYNAAVIYNNLEEYTKAADILAKSVDLFPKNKEMATLYGEMKFYAEDYAGAVPILRRAIALDPQEARPHQVLFNALVKLKKTDEAQKEYWIYRALQDGTPKRSNIIKIWCDAADNRFGAGNDLNGVRTTLGYPEEVRDFSDEGKVIETWFYWTKGKCVTFQDGKKVSEGTFPPVPQSQS
jgi:tetratricopeptide (TPR) repeat protein